jgi:hypothetical protein
MRSEDTTEMIHEAAETAMEIPMQPISKSIREFIRAADVLLQDINEDYNCNDFEKVLLTSYANRLNAANTVLQSRALQREAQEWRKTREQLRPQPIFKQTD